MTIALYAVALVFAVGALVFVMLYYRKVSGSGEARARLMAQRLPPPQDGAGQWYGCIVGDLGFGFSAGIHFGVFDVGRGRMTFTPADAPEPDWIARCDTLVVKRLSEFVSTAATLSLTWPEQTGLRTAKLTVSRESINAHVQDRHKLRRERVYAEEFLVCLLDNGARVNA